MRRRLVDALFEVIEAEKLATQLRRAHGPEAERRCDELLARATSSGPERERLEDARRALRWL
jgi:hypothetical protein